MKPGELSNGEILERCLPRRDLAKKFLRTHDSVPERQLDNSPAFQRRVWICNVTSPEGTAEMPPCPT